MNTRSSPVQECSPYFAILCWSSGLCPYVLTPSMHLWVLSRNWIQGRPRALRNPIFDRSLHEDLVCKSWEFQGTFTQFSKTHVTHCELGPGCTLGHSDDLHSPFLEELMSPLCRGGCAGGFQHEILEGDSWLAPRDTDAAHGPFLTHTAPGATARNAVKNQC